MPDVERASLDLVSTPRMRICLQAARKGAEPAKRLTAEGFGNVESACLTATPLEAAEPGLRVVPLVGCAAAECGAPGNQEGGVELPVRGTCVQRGADAPPRGKRAWRRVGQCARPPPERANRAAVGGLSRFGTTFRPGASSIRLNSGIAFRRNSPFIRSVLEGEQGSQLRRRRPWLSSRSHPSRCSRI